MARSNISLDFPTPDFSRIREEAGHVTVEAVRSLYFSALDTRRRLQRIQQELGWQSTPFLAGNFTANSGTWTVASADQKQYQYIKIGQFLVVNFFLEDTTTGSGMGNQLQIQLPKGMKAAATTYTGPLIVRGQLIQRVTSRRGARISSIASALTMQHGPPVSQIMWMCAGVLR